MVLRITGQVFKKMFPLVEICLMVISWLVWGYKIWGGRRSQRLPFFITLYQGCILHHDLINLHADFDRMTEILFVRFLHCKVTFSLSFSYFTFCKEVPMCCPHFTSSKLFSTSSSMEYLHKHIVFLWSHFPFHLCFLYSKMCDYTNFMLIFINMLLYFTKIRKWVDFQLVLCIL